VAQLATEIIKLPGLKFRGLMSIPASADEEAKQRAPFAQMRRLFEQLNQQGLALDTLSMGMSHDYAVAIQEGATIVRIGTAIFGTRQYGGEK